MSDLATLTSINEKLNIMTFANVGYDDFSLVGNPVPWIYKFCPDFKPANNLQLKNIFIFLDDFLEQAKEQFDSGDTTLIRSGPWSERDITNIERNLSALALKLGDTFIVQISLIAEEHRYHQRIFQKAREYSLEFERINKNKDNKEVIMHSVIHDLSGPLTSIGGALNILSDFDLDKSKKKKFKEIVESQIDAANEMIKGIFDVFTPEEDGLNSTTEYVEEISVIFDSLNKVIENFSPAFKQQNVQLVLENNIYGTNIKVRTEQQQFVRVFINLLENALRYSPVGSKVLAKLEEENDKVCISIEDEGPGVPENLVNSIFKRFVGGEQYGGKAGFGLYYCQICVRRWGGEIKYSRGAPDKKTVNPEAGACFKIYLPKVY